MPDPHPIQRTRPAHDLAAVGVWLGRKGAGSSHPRFLRQMLAPLWDNADDYGVDPFGVIAMAAHETAYGNYTGAVPASAKNTCGLRVDSDALGRIGKVSPTPAADATAALLLELSHARFATWELGARAHVQHVVSYLGDAAPRIPWHELADPRYTLVRGLNRTASTWLELGDLWATDGYGIRLDRAVTELTEIAG